MWERNVFLVYIFSDLAKNFLENILSKHEEIKFKKWLKKISNSQIQHWGDGGGVGLERFLLIKMFIYSENIHILHTPNQIIFSYG